MAAGSAGGAALLQSASEAAQRGGVQDSKALFAQALAAARAENSLQIERDACLGLAEMAWQVIAAAPAQYLALPAPERVLVHCQAPCIATEQLAPACVRLEAANDSSDSCRSSVSATKRSRTTTELSSFHSKRATSRPKVWCSSAKALRS